LTGRRQVVPKEAADTPSRQRQPCAAKTQRSGLGTSPGCGGSNVRQGAVRGQGPTASAAMQSLRPSPLIYDWFARTLQARSATLGASGPDPVSIHVNGLSRCRYSGIYSAALIYLRQESPTTYRSFLGLGTTMKRFFRSMASNFSVVGELLSALGAHRLWWLIPMVFILLLFALFVIIASTSGLGPLIYTLF
jgi:hypothetical protein